MAISNVAAPAQKHATDAAVYTALFYFMITHANQLLPVKLVKTNLVKLKLTMLLQHVVLRFVIHTSNANSEHR